MFKPYVERITPPTVEAFQWKSPGDNVPGLIKEELRSLTVTTSHGLLDIRATYHLVIDPGYTVTLKPGDWIVKDLKTGVLSKLGNEAFKAKYASS